MDDPVTPLPSHVYQDLPQNTCKPTHIQHSTCWHATFTNARQATVPQS